MSNLGITLKGRNTHDPNFNRTYYANILLDAGQLRGAAPLKDLVRLLPKGAGIKLEFERERIILRPEELLECHLNTVEMLPDQAYPIGPNQEAKTLTIGELELEVSVFEV